MNPKDGGPAFPCDHLSDFYSKGMTLRDWFAGQVLMGLLASRNSNSPRFHPEDDAAYVYAVADAALKAREAQP